MIRSIFFAIALLSAAAAKPQEAPAAPAAVQTETPPPATVKRAHKPSAAPASGKPAAAKSDRRSSKSGATPAPQAEEVGEREKPRGVEGDLPIELDAASFGTGAEGGQAAAQQADTVEKSATRGEGFLSSSGTLMFVIAGGFGLFLALLIAAVLLARRDIAKARRANQKISERISAMNAKIDAAVSLPIASLQRDVAELKQQTEALARASATMPKAPLTGNSPMSGDLHEDLHAWRPAVVDRTPSRFPALVSDVVAQSNSTTLRVKADPLDHDVFVPSSDGAFYLVNDGTTGPYVIPAHEPMTTQLYKTYYKSSYDCSVQGAGDLYVIEPATVRARGELWRLTTRGKLEVRGA